VKFTVFNIGNRKDIYEERVTINYTDKNGEETFFGSMTKDDLKVINEGLSKKDRNDWFVEIYAKDVKSISVYLEDTLASKTNVRAKVNLGPIEYCTWEPPNSGS